MRIASCTILHYGREWLGYALRSVSNFVDASYIFYTATPSHGHSGNLANPETANELRGIAFMPDKSKALWVDCPTFNYEYEHRNYAIQTIMQGGYDMVVVLDADELWSQDVLQNAIRYANAHPENGDWRIGMRHMWRGLSYVCDDEAMPQRIINLRSPNLGHTIGYLSPTDIGKVFHMGYAQTPKIVEYKLSIHGHKDELRPNWFKDIFMAWYPTKVIEHGVHPTNLDFWTPRPSDTDAVQRLSRLCKDHPYWDRSLIE